MNRLFIINPTAGGGIKGKRFLRLKNYALNTLGEFNHYFCQDHQDMVARAQIAAKTGIQQIIIWGGDGSINAVVNSLIENGKLINPDCKLVVSPTGSGSDYYKTIYQNSNKHWYHTIDKFQVKNVDIAKIEYADPKIPFRYFVNVTSIGLGADVVAKREQTKSWVPRTLSYIVPSLLTLPKAHSTKYKLIIDGETHSLDLMGLFVAKGTYAGGGMKLGSNAVIDDGQLDLCLLKKMNMVEMTLKMKKLYTDEHKTDPKIMKLKGKKIEVITPIPVQVECDGELHGATNCAFSVCDKVLPVCFPI